VQLREEASDENVVHILGPRRASEHAVEIIRELVQVVAVRSDGVA
jgi:hypothetical protein